MPFSLRYFFSQLIAFFVYIPLSRFSLILDKMGLNEKYLEIIPLSFYRNRTIYTIRTDALDRFGTRLEKRFSKKKYIK